jgi:hypothetical protein
MVDSLKQLTSDDFDELPVGRKKELLRTVIRRITVEQEKLVIEPELSSNVIYVELYEKAVPDPSPAR